MGDEHEIGWDDSCGHVRVKTDAWTRLNLLGDAVQCMMATCVKHGRRKDRGTDDGFCMGRMLTDACHIVLQLQRLRRASLSRTCPTRSRPPNPPTTPRRNPAVMRHRKGSDSISFCCNRAIKRISKAQILTKLRRDDMPHFHLPAACIQRAYMSMRKMFKPNVGAGALCISVVVLRSGRKEKTFICTRGFG